MFVYNNQNKLNLFNVIENKIYVIYTSKGNLKIVPNNVIINKNDSITLEVVYDGINDFEWHSSNEGFVTIKNGTIFALEEGSVIITCTAKDNPKISATCNVEVIGDGAIISNDRIIENEYPYISVYNFEPTLDINEQLDIQYYITDYTQKEIRENDYTDKFIVNCSIYTMPNENGDITLLSNRVIDNVNPGDNTISFTSAELGGVGDKFLVLEGKDINSEKHTHEFIKEFRVINKSSEQQNIDNNTYYMTTSDLSSYNIDNKWKKDSQGKWESYLTYCYNPNQIQCLHGTESALIASKYIKLTDEIIRQFEVDPASSGNLVNNFNNIDEVLVWVTFSEDIKQGVIRVNVRSRGPIINKVLERYNGGGHKFASGARIKTFDEMEEIVKDLDEVCKEYKGK